MTNPDGKIAIITGRGSGIIQETPRHIFRQIDSRQTPFAPLLRIASLSRILNALVFSAGLLVLMAGCDPAPSVGQWSDDSQRFVYLLSPAPLDSAMGRLERDSAGAWNVSFPVEMSEPALSKQFSKIKGNDQGTCGFALDAKLERLAVVWPDNGNSRIGILISPWGGPPQDPVYVQVPQDAGPDPLGVQRRGVQHRGVYPLGAYWTPDGKRILISAVGGDQKNQFERLATFSYDIETKKLTTFPHVVACPFRHRHTSMRWPWLGTPIRPDGKGFLALHSPPGKHRSLAFVEFGGEIREFVIRNRGPIDFTTLMTMRFDGVHQDQTQVSVGEMLGWPQLRWDGETAIVALGARSELTLDTQKLICIAHDTAPIDRGKPPLWRYEFPGTKVVIKVTLDKVPDAPSASPESHRRELVTANPETGIRKVIATGNRDCRFVYCASPDEKWAVVFVLQGETKPMNGLAGRDESGQGFLVNSAGEVVKEWNAKSIP